MAVLAAVGHLSGAEHIERRDPTASPRRSCRRSPTSPGSTSTSPSGCSSTAAERPRARDRRRAELRDGGTRVADPAAATSARSASPPPQAPYDTDDVAFLDDPRRPRRARARQRPARDRPALHPRAAGRRPRQRSPRPSPSTTTRARRSTPTRPPRGCSAGAPPEDVTAARPGELAARFIDHQGGRLAGRGPGPAGPPARRRRARAASCSPAASTARPGARYWLLTKATLLEDQGRNFAVNIIEDVTDSKEAEQRQRFLAQAGQLLASSLDYEQTLQRVAQLAVPWLADWCAVDMPDEQGGIQQVALAHVDPAKIAMAEELRRRYPPDPNAPNGVPGVLRGGPPELLRRDPRRAARAGDRRSRAARGDPRDRHALGDGRPDARRRADARRAHARQRRQRPPLQRRRLRVRPGPRAARRDRDPERPPVRGAGPRRAHAAGQPAAGAAARAAGLGRRRRPTRRASRAPRSAATSTTSSPPTAAATSCSSAT